LNATELADYLVLKGMPFREAHHLTGAVVKYCIENHLNLMSLALNKYQLYSPLITTDVYDYLSCETAIKNKKSYGSTSYIEVKADTERLNNWLSVWMKLSF
jgi:argininosuccinate lyase